MNIIAIRLILVVALASFIIMRKILTVVVTFLNACRSILLSFAVPLITTGLDFIRDVLQITLINLFPSYNKFLIWLVNLMIIRCLGSLPCLPNCI